MVCAILDGRKTMTRRVVGEDKRKNLWPTCQVDGKPKGENDKPCLIWMERGDKRCS